MDKYMANIELSNACREFYQSRLIATEKVKAKLAIHDESESANANKEDKRPLSRWSSLDVAMEKLRKEMASLMDQDLSLMKQLLTLNESIEDLKWRRRYATTNIGGSFPLSSLSDMDEFSDTDMYDSQTDVKISGCSNLSLYNSLDRRTAPVTMVTSDFLNGNVNMVSGPTTSTMKRTSELTGSQSHNDRSSSKALLEDDRGHFTGYLDVPMTTTKGKVIQMYPSDQSSFDSGIQSDEERVVLV